MCPHPWAFLPNDTTEIISSFKLAKHTIQWINCDQIVYFKTKWRFECQSTEEFLSTVVSKGTNN